MAVTVEFDAEAKAADLLRDRFFVLGAADRDEREARNGEGVISVGRSMIRQLRSVMGTFSSSYRCTATTTTTTTMRKMVVLETVSSVSVHRN